MTLSSFEHSELALEKAFDTVDHSILLKKLILFNILLKEFQMNGLHHTSKAGNNLFQSVIISQVLKQVIHRALFWDPSFFYYMNSSACHFADYTNILLSNDHLNC